MGKNEYKVRFNAEGFLPGKDITEEEWSEICDQFAAMNNYYANGFNSIIDRLNETWNTYEMNRKNDAIAEAMMQISMGITDETAYWDWVEMWMQKVSQAVDLTAEMAGFRLRSNIIRDGEFPVYGAKFTDHPDWTIDMTLYPAE